MTVSAPTTIDDLLDRAQRACGYTFSELAEAYDILLPNTPKNAKGFVGQIIEHALGADAGSQARPDFTQLDIELKTIPVNQQNKVQESTYVCMVPLKPGPEQYWSTSVVYKKLKHVLWFVIEADKSIPFHRRRFLKPILQQPSDEQLAALQTDFEEIMELICFGQLSDVTAKMGTYLHVRPKAMNAKVLAPTFDDEGISTKTLPRGFYLRQQFTQRIINDCF